MRILKIDPKKIEKEKLLEMANLIRQGKVMICPTDTVYGLIADATNKKAVEKIFKIKKRPTNKPIPIFVRDIKMARKLAKINRNQEKFLEKAWPGKITVILRPKRKFPEGIGKSKKEIGLRVPNYEIINQLLRPCHRPLTGTSANISGKPASTKIKEVLKQFENQKDQPDLIIDAGNLPKNKPSTIIDLTISPPKVLRY